MNTYVSDTVRMKSIFQTISFKAFTGVHVQKAYTSLGTSCK